MRVMGNKYLPIEIIRQKNLRLIQDEVGGQAEMVDITGKSQTLLSNLIGKNPTKNIGSALARELETMFGKPYAWMDTPQWLENDERARIKKDIDSIPDSHLDTAATVLKALKK